MKTILSLLSILYLFPANSQSLVLTQAVNEPHAGDSSYYYVIDSSAYPNILPVALTGSNTLWNFTNMNVLGISANSYYLNPSAVSGSTAYPGTTVVQKQGALYNFYKSVSSPTTQTELLGTVSNTSNLTFTNTAVLAKYPIAYGGSFSDNVGGAFTFSVNGTFTGSVSTIADGTGTLQLPGGVVFTNVLRLKSIQVLNLSLGIIPFGTARQTVYNYFHASQKFPVLNITYTSLSVLGSSSPSVSAVITGNSKVLTVGLEEESRFEQNVEIFPNPSKDLVTISFTNQETSNCLIRLFNIQGKEVMVKELGNARTVKSTLDVKDLPNGLYFVSILSGNQSGYKKLIVEH